MDYKEVVKRIRVSTEEKAFSVFTSPIRVPQLCKWFLLRFVDFTHLNVITTSFFLFLTGHSIKSVHCTTSFSYIKFHLEITYSKIYIRIVQTYARYKSMYTVYTNMMRVFSVSIPMRLTRT